MTDYAKPWAGFEFDEKRHVYTLDGNRMYGVTTVLGVINKPALVPWAAKMVTEHIKEYADMCMVGAKHFMVTRELLEEAKGAHNKKKEAGATTGTDVHRECELIIKKAIKANGGVVKLKKHKDPMVQNFLDWCHKDKPRFLASELRLFSRDLWVAGTCDFLFELPNGERVIGDLKTTGGIWDRTPFFQCAGYEIMAGEQGYGVFNARCIVRCGKDGTFEVVYSRHPIDKQGFLSALELFKALEIPATEKQKHIKRAVNKKKNRV